MPSRPYVALIAVLSLVGLVPLAHGQIVRFLLPDSFTPPPQADVRVHIEADRAPAPWPADRAEWLFVKGSGRQTNLHDVAPDNAADQSVTIRSSANGVTVAGLNLRPMVETHARETLAKTLPSLVNDPPTLPDRETIRVRRVESLTTMLRVEPHGGNSPVATQKTSQRVEIRALFDPTAATPGSDVPVRVYDDLGGASGIKIHAECLEGGAATIVTADRSGIAYLPITHTGVWRVQAHAAKPAPPGSDADIVLYSCTLTFRVTREEAE